MGRVAAGSGREAEQPAVCQGLGRRFTAAARPTAVTVTAYPV
jgi:hypothetical protein